MIETRLGIIIIVGVIPTVVLVSLGVMYARWDLFVKVARIIGYYDEIVYHPFLISRHTAAEHWERAKARANA